MRKFLVLLGVVGLILAGTSQAQAITFFSDRSLWETSAGSFSSVDLTGIPEYSAVTSVSVGSETLAFDKSLTRYKVGSSWATWSGGNQPEILYTGGATSVTGTFSPSSMGAFGLEMEPNPFAVYSMTLDVGQGQTLTQDVSGSAGAKFFGWTGGSVSSLTISAPVDFAFGRMVYSTSLTPVPDSVVPEPATMALLSSGLFGLLGLRRKSS